MKYATPGLRTLVRATMCATLGLKVLMVTGMVHVFLGHNPQTADTRDGLCARPAWVGVGKVGGGAGKRLTPRSWTREAARSWS